MTEQQKQILHAAVDRIIPADDFPGAWEAGVGDYIERQLGGDLHNRADLMAQGLAALDAEAFAQFQKHLPQLEAAQQDEVMHRVEEGLVQSNWPTDPIAFFAMLVDLTMEGYYSDPGNGGNRNQIAWRMIGYEPRQQVKNANST